MIYIQWNGCGWYVPIKLVTSENIIFIRILDVHYDKDDAERIIQDMPYTLAYGEPKLFMELPKGMEKPK